MITITQTINSSLEKVWEYWIKPEHIVKWNFASDDWHVPAATNDVTVGGKLKCRMEAKNGSEGFDFVATYSEVVPQNKLVFVLDDGRTAEVVFKEVEDGILVTETFEAEQENPLDMQQAGWQSILDNFKKYTEAN